MADDRQICPWCDTEIVWDPELGPEEACPHCFNELGEYRTMNFEAGIELQEDEGRTDRSGGAVGAKGEVVRWQDVLGEDEDEDDEDDGEELARPRYESAGVLSARAGTGFAGLEQELEELIDEQDECPQCDRCDEYMLEAGTQRVDAGFKARVPGAVGRALMQTPYQLKLYVCPSCFKAEYQLSEEDRALLASRLREMNRK